MLDRRLSFAYCALRLGLGVSAFASGLYTLHASTDLPRLTGAIELGAGILIFTPLSGVAARLLTGWLLLLALKLLMAGGSYDTAAGDVMLAAGAFALARFTTVNEAAPGEFTPTHHCTVDEGVVAHRNPMSV
jgi:hypothetical protein